MIEAKHTVPKEGLDHPAFSEISASDDLIVRLFYDHNLTDEELGALDGIIGRWVEAEDWAGASGQPELKEAVEGRISMVLRFSAATWSPRAPLERLVGMLGDLGVGIHELFLARWEPKNDEGLMGPVKEPEAPEEEQSYYDDPDSYFDAVFDPAAPPPATENDLDCKGILSGQDGQVSIEMRAHRLFHPKVRIAYGIYEGYRTIAGDDRTAEVEKVLAEELERELATAWSFDHEPWTPKPSTFAREQGHVDTLVARGRRGYEMLFFANTLRVHIDTEFRQREPEVMRALAATAERLDLEPVIMWMRMGIPQPMMAYKEPFKYFFQLWEKADYEAPEVTLVEAPTYPPETAEGFFDEWMERTVERWHLRRKPRSDLASLESWYGLELPPDLRRVLSARDRVSFNTRFIGNWVLDDADLPMPTADEGNLFEQLLHPDLHRLLLGAFSLAVPFGYLDGSGLDLWAGMVPGAESATVCTHDPRSHECHLIADSVPSLLLMTELASRQYHWERAMDEADAAQSEPGSDFDPGPMPDLSLLSGRVQPLADFSNLYLDGALPDEPGAGTFLYRSYSLLQLLGAIEAPDLEVVAQNFSEMLGGPRPSYRKTVDSGNASKLPVSAFYWLWAFFFTADERLDEMVDLCLSSASPLIRDAGALVGDLQGGRKDLGPFEDVHGRRDAFLEALAAAAPAALDTFRG